jgi:tripartite-type tricarboxylate transporter receptor subunit TctC
MASLRAVAAACAALVVGSLMPVSVPAQTFPTKPVRLLVGFVPGGGADFHARLIGTRLSELWGQPVVVENRAGAAGLIATEALVKAPADGYTLLLATVTSAAIAPSVARKPPFDPVRDVAPVAFVGQVPNVLTVHPAFAARTVREIAALAKARPGELTYASSGVGSTQHLAGLMFSLATGAKLTHVPYKGSGAAVVDLMGGHVTMNFDTMPSVIEQIRAGKLRAVAVTTRKRSSQLPDVPTMEEAGFPGVEMATWYAVYAPAGTPRSLIERLNADINRVLKEPEVRGKLSAVGSEAGGGTVDEFDGFHRAEIARYLKIIRATGVQVD